MNSVGFYAVFAVFVCGVTVVELQEVLIDQALQHDLKRFAETVKGPITIEVVEQQVPSTGQYAINQPQRHYYPNQQFQTNQQYIQGQQYYQNPQYRPVQQYQQQNQANLNGYDAAIIIEETNQPGAPAGNVFVVTKNNGVYPINQNFHNHPHGFGPPHSHGHYPPPGPLPPPMGPPFGPPPFHKHGYPAYPHDYTRYPNYPEDGHGPTTENINLSELNERKNTFGSSTRKTNHNGSTTTTTEIPKAGPNGQEFAPDDVKNKSPDDTSITFKEDESKDEANVAGYIGKFPVILLNENEIR